MKALLLSHGVPLKAIQVEPHSIDTATNFVFVERDRLCGDDSPIGIVAQEKHLERMMDIVAPKTLRRPFLGIVVPEVEKDQDSVLARMVSRAVLLGITPERLDSDRIVLQRVESFWRAVLLAERLRPGDRAAYMTET